MKVPVTFINRKNCSLLLLGIAVVGGMAASVSAQSRDPFYKPVVKAARAKPTGTAAVRAAPKKPAGPSVIAVPPIQSRIDGYRAVRQRCAELGVACPKPTSVLTLDEMQVTGIFRTPRGYAAMVAATPINLSYTIYPGEKFYDGQLVAIEESRLVFRKVTRMTDGKEIVAVDNKGLVQETINDLAASRTETVVPTVTAPTVTAPASATGAPQISAEAVPMTNAAEAAPAPKPVEKVVEKKKGVDAKGLNRNSIESSDKPATKVAAPAAVVEVAPNDDAPAAPAKPKAKGSPAKSKAKSKK